MGLIGIPMVVNPAFALPQLFAPWRPPLMEEAQMLQVVRNLVCRDTVALSKWLLQHALTGELQGIAIEVRLRDGAHDVMFTGCYSSPRNALAAAAEIYRRACELFDDHLDTPPWSNKR